MNLFLCSLFSTNVTSLLTNQVSPRLYCVQYEVSVIECMLGPIDWLLQTTCSNKKLLSSLSSSLALHTHQQVRFVALSFLSVVVYLIILTISPCSLILSLFYRLTVRLPQPTVSSICQIYFLSIIHYCIVLWLFISSCRWCIQPPHPQHIVRLPTRIKRVNYDGASVLLAWMRMVYRFRILGLSIFKWSANVNVSRLLLLS